MAFFMPNLDKRTFATSVLPEAEAPIKRIIWLIISNLSPYLGDFYTVSKIFSMQEAISLLLPK